MLTEALEIDVSDPLRPVLVFVVKDGDELVELVPRYDDGPEPGGLFLPGPFTHHIVLRLDQGPQSVYHEYFHLLTRLNSAQLPVWLVEGLAEFYGNADLTSRTAKFGIIDSDSLRYLRGRSDFPLQAVLSQSTNPHEGNPREIQVFYALSWALTHYLLIGDEELAARGALVSYMHLLQQGRSSLEAFSEAVGDVDTYEERLRVYIRQVRFRHLLVDVGEDVDDDSFTTRRLTPAEIIALRTGIMTWGGDPDGDRTLALLNEALTLDGDLASVHEATGMFHWVHGRPEEAGPWFKRAVQSGSTSYAAHYMHALSMAEDRTVEGRAARLESLRRATALNPRFAPAFLELSRIHWNNSDLERARVATLDAIQFDPTSIPAWVRLGQIYLRLDRLEEAQLVAERGMTWVAGAEDRELMTELPDAIAAYVEEQQRRQAFGDAPASVSPADPDVGQRDVTASGPAAPVASSASASDSSPRTVTGTWTALDCVNGALEFVVHGPNAVYVLRAAAPEPVEILDANGAVQERIFCGAVDREVTVEFVPTGDADSAGAVRGALTSLSFP